MIFAVYSSDSLELMFQNHLLLYCLLKSFLNPKSFCGSFVKYFQRYVAFAYELLLANELTVSSHFIKFSRKMSFLLQFAYDL